MMDPGLWCRLIAKIAHAAAVAELGFDGFKPFLPPAILGDDKHVSHLVGQAKKKHTKVFSAPYHIELHIESGYIIARVHLFAHLGQAPMEAIVGTPSPAFGVQVLRADKYFLDARPVEFPLVR